MDNEQQHKAYCDWCGEEFDEDDLSILPNASLVCKEHYEEAMQELAGES